MYSTFRDQREKSPVDWPTCWPTSPGTSRAADVSQPARAGDISSPLSKSTYSSSHAVSSTTPFNDLTARHARFLHTPGGRLSTNEQSFPSQHLSEPNIQSVAAQLAPHYPLSNATETRNHQQLRQQQHLHGL
jgi:hypothetical protein